jgi:hypothetical protein
MTISYIVTIHPLNTEKISPSEKLSDYQAHLNTTKIGYIYEETKNNQLS